MQVLLPWGLLLQFNITSIIGDMRRSVIHPLSDLRTPRAILTQLSLAHLVNLGKDGWYNIGDLPGGLVWLGALLFVA